MNLRCVAGALVFPREDVLARQEVATSTIPIGQKLERTHALLTRFLLNHHDLATIRCHCFRQLFSSPAEARPDVQVESKQCLI